jgi:hypothetical protein
MCAGGGGGKVSEDFFLCPYRNNPRFPAPPQEIPWEFPSLSLSQTGRNFRPRLMKKYHTEPGKKFRSEEGVDPGSELQNYDDSLRKFNVLLQCIVASRIPA